jgi:hypothetical protein
MRLAGEEAEKRKPQVVAALRETLARYEKPERRSGDRRALVRAGAQYADIGLLARTIAFRTRMQRVQQDRLRLGRGNAVQCRMTPSRRSYILLLVLASVVISTASACARALASSCSRWSRASASRRELRLRHRTAKPWCGGCRNPSSARSPTATARGPW